MVAGTQDESGAVAGMADSAGSTEPTQPRTKALSTVLVLGCRGMLGSSCVRVFGSAAIGCDMGEFDIAHRESVLEAVGRLRPDVIVNCAAATDVDRCETDHGYADRANAIGPGFLAEAASLVGARFVQVSTDFVFDGNKGVPYSEIDPPNPISYYGRSKLEGEKMVLATLPSALVVRTSWLYGHGSSHFPAKVLGWAAGRQEIQVADDQFGSPSCAVDLAEGLRRLVLIGAEGVFHLAGAGCASRLELARETLMLTQTEVRLVAVSASLFTLPAPRPVNSCLDCSKAASLGVVLPPWRESLKRYLVSR